jgi:Transposase
VIIRLRVARLRCRNGDCQQQIFGERVSGVAEARLRRTCRVLDLVHLLGHTAGGKPAERLLRRLGFPASDDTIVHHLKRRARGAEGTAPLRVVGIDDWAWRKGQTYGTVMVDLERRRVVDILSERSSAGTAAWLRTHSHVEIVCRDRQGLFAEGTRDGAPRAIQVADRFQLIQNLRERIEQQLGRLGGRSSQTRRPPSSGRRPGRVCMAPGRPCLPRCAPSSARVRPRAPLPRSSASAASGSTAGSGWRRCRHVTSWRHRHVRPAISSSI